MRGVEYRQRHHDRFSQRAVAETCRPGVRFVSAFGKTAATFLPVREGENVFVWFASFADEHACAAYHASLNSDGNPPRADLSALQARRQEVLELIPTNRSLLRHTVVNSYRSKKHG